MTTLREKWSAGDVTLGAWLSIPSSVSAEHVGKAGFDYCNLDLQHGLIDYTDAVSMIQAVLLAGGTPTARAPWNEPGIIGKLLDAGAEGVIVPMVNSAEEAAAVVRAMRYPPHGMRSFGPTLTALRDSRYHARTFETTAVIPMIETLDALRDIDEILAVPGIDAIYVGPADLSASLGLPPQNNDGTELFDNALADIVAACRKAGVVPGIHASAPLCAKRLEQGFRMITVSNDVVTLRAGLHQELAQARGAGGAASSSKSVY